MEKNKNIWTKIEDLKSVKLNSLPVCVDRYIKTKIKTNDDKVYTNFRAIFVPEVGVECESFTIFYIDSLLVYESNLFETN